MIGLVELARRLGLSAPAVSKWLARGVPLDRCVVIECATAGEVRCEELRPDVAWRRDGEGQVTGYTVPVEPAETRAA
jgi:DNA-binding transcriptional regulator YdaS (Cro superfamily)